MSVLGPSLVPLRLSAFLGIEVNGPTTDVREIGVRRMWERLELILMAILASVTSDVIVVVYSTDVGVG